jgi:hypothetical protein
MGNENKSSLPRTNPACEQHGLIYEIQVKGCMDTGFWSDWFGDMEFTIDVEHGETTLRGPIADQAALYGLLSRLRNKGQTLLSVHQISE